MKHLFGVSVATLINVGMPACDAKKIVDNLNACNQGRAAGCTGVGLCEWKDPHHEHWVNSLTHLERGCRLGDTAACDYHQELSLQRQQWIEQRYGKATPVASAIAPAAPKPRSGPQTDYYREAVQRREQQRQQSEERNRNYK